MPPTKTGIPARCAGSVKKLITCAACGKEKPYYAKGLCRACYQKRPEARGTCAKCGRTNTLLKVGLCGSCYQTRPAARGTCAECGKEDTPLATGLCRSCYRKRPEGWRKCAECGKEKLFYAKRLCGSCYFKQKRRGLPHKDFISALEHQDNKCAICKKHLSEKTAKVDHNHITGVVRGVLCNTCTRVIGYAEENMSILDDIKDYLDEHKEKTS